MCTRIAHGEVQGLRVGRFDLGINTALVVYRFGETAVDAGPANRWPAVRRFLSEEPLRMLLLTHHHEDHSGNAEPIQRELGAEVLAPEASLPLLEQGFPLQLYRRLIWGRPRPLRARALPAEVELPGGYRLEVLPTPGHADDMVCLLEPGRGWLFTSDLFIAERIRMLRREDDVGTEIESLRSVLRRDFQTVFCAHRGPVEDGRAALGRKLDFLVSLREEVLSLRGRGLPPREIARRLLGREGLMSWLTGFHFSKRNLVESCLRSARPA